MLDWWMRADESGLSENVVEKQLWKFICSHGEVFSWQSNISRRWLGAKSFSIWAWSKCQAWSPATSSPSPPRRRSAHTYTHAAQRTQEGQHTQCEMCLCVFHRVGFWGSDCMGQPRQRCSAGALGSPDGTCPPAASLQRIPGAGMSICVRVFLFWSKHVLLNWTWLLLTELSWSLKQVPHSYVLNFVVNE